MDIFTFNEKSRRLPFLVFLWLLVLPVQAYEPYTGWDILDIGLRGGGTALLGGTDFTTEVGYSAGLDVNYRLVVPVAKGVGIGPKVGLGATYRTTRLRCNQSDWQFTEISTKGLRLLDHLDLRGMELNHQWQMEIPLMMAINAKQVVLNLGVVPVVGLTQQHRTQLDHTDVTSVIDVVAVEMHNTLVQREDGQRFQPQFHLLAGGEIGYEFMIDNEHRLGLQAYCRYDVLAEHPWSDNAFCRWEGNRIVVGSLTEAIPEKLHYMDFGLRVYYTFAQPHGFRRLGLRY